MTAFRLFNISIDDGSFHSDTVNLINPLHHNNTFGNYFSLIIGDNGTGKSRVLSNIAKVYKSIFNNKYNHNLFDSKINLDTLPTKVIAITNSLSDKFPLDDSFKRYESVYNRYTTENNPLKSIYSNSKYIYLGTRSKNLFFSNKASINRALDILLEYYSETEISQYYRHVFNYLDFEPILKLQYKIPKSFFSFKENKINKRILSDYIDQKRYYKRERIDFSEKTKAIIDTVGDEICDFLNHSKLGKQGFGEILINFSEKNIERYSYDKSQYYGNTYEYRMLNILRKLNIIGSYDIKIYKKGGLEFSFNEASSGEANILSTLLALIPLLDHNSLVLIDEPEISLHPIWQAKYIELLNKIFSHFTGCHIIIASHSHFLVTDLPPKQSTVVALRSNKKGNIVSEIMKESTFGWSAEDVLLNVFGLPTTRNYYLSQLISKGLELLANNNRNFGEYNKIKSQIKEYYPLMKDNDPLKSVAAIILNES